MDAITCKVKVIRETAKAYGLEVMLKEYDLEKESYAYAFAWVPKSKVRVFEREGSMLASMPAYIYENNVLAKGRKGAK